VGYMNETNGQQWLWVRGSGIFRAGYDAMATKDYIELTNDM